MMVSGYLINRFGAKHVAFVSAIGMTLTTALMPTAAYLGIYYFFALRVIFGIFEVSQRLLKTSTSKDFPESHLLSAHSPIISMVSTK